MQWEIEPNPYDSDVDYYVTTSNADALEALKDVAEMVWDSMEIGDARIIKIRRRKIEEE